MTIAGNKGSPVSVVIGSAFVTAMRTFGVFLLCYASAAHVMFARAGTIGDKRWAALPYVTALTFVLPFLLSNLVAGLLRRRKASVPAGLIFGLLVSSQTNELYYFLAFGLGFVDWLPFAAPAAIGLLFLALSFPKTATAGG